MMDEELKNALEGVNDVPEDKIWTRLTCAGCGRESEFRVRGRGTVKGDRTAFSHGWSVSCDPTGASDEPQYRCPECTAKLSVAELMGTEGDDPIEATAAALEKLHLRCSTDSLREYGKTAAEAALAMLRDPKIQSDMYGVCSSLLYLHNCSGFAPEEKLRLEGRTLCAYDMMLSLRMCERLHEED